MMGGCPRTGSKLERRRQALLFQCRREGLFQPVGNVLDKNQLMIYQYISQSFVGDCTPPRSLGWDGMGWWCHLSSPWVVAQCQC